MLRALILCVPFVDGASVFQHWRSLVLVARSSQDLERPAWPATTAKKACLAKLQVIALRRYIGLECSTQRVTKTFIG